MTAPFTNFPIPTTPLTSVQIIAAGATTGRNLPDRFADVINAKDYGVVADGTTDDTAALQAAINATPSNCTLQLPRGSIKVLGSGSAALTATKAMSIVGQGWATAIVPGAGFPNTRDFLSITPATADAGIFINDFSIKPSNLGRHAIRIDGGSNSVIYNIHIGRMLILPTNAGNSINGIGSGSSGGVFAYSTIYRNNLESIDISTCGDGLTISDNVFTTALPNANISVVQVAGAGNLVIRNNIFVGVSGAILVGRSSSLVVDANEIEQASTLTESFGAIIDIHGTSGVVLKPRIINNIINVSGAGTGVSTLIRFNACDAPYINANWLNAKSGNHITFTANVTDAVIGPGNSYYTNGIAIPGTISGAATALRTGITSAEHILTLSANQTGADSSTAQTWFPGGGATTITVIDATAYEFEAVLAYARTAGTTSHTTQLLFGGTATVTSIAYDVMGTETTSGFFAGGTQARQFATATNSITLFSATTSATYIQWYQMKGIIRFNTGGTFTPQFKFSAAPGGAPTIQANSFFKMRLIGPVNFTSMGFT